MNKEIIGICVCTYKRPQNIDNLISYLIRLEIPKLSKTYFKIIIVDNDINESAKDIIEKHKTNSENENIIYDVEPEKGISYARNRCISIAKRLNCTYIAFIDDDEYPSSKWIKELLSALKTFNADVVFGPVIPDYDNKVPNWIIRGRFFERDRCKTGTMRATGGTGNVIFKTDLLNAHNVFFDLKFALSGGEDTLFFMKLKNCGAKMIWCDEGIVREFIPPERANIKWLLRRAFRLGNSISLAERITNKIFRVKLYRMCKAFGNISIGIYTLLKSLFLGRITFMQGLLRIMRGTGQLVGMFGIRINEY